MTLWVQLPVDVYEHPRMLAAVDDRDGGDAALALFCAGLAYAKKHGIVPTGAMRLLTRARRPQRVANCLVRHGLWERLEGGYRHLDLDASHVLAPMPAAAPEAQCEMRRAPMTSTERVRQHRAREREMKRHVCNDVTAGETADVTETVEGETAESVSCNAPLSALSPQKEEEEQEREKEKNTDSARESGVSVRVSGSVSESSSERYTSDETHDAAPVTKRTEARDATQATVREVLEHWAATLYPNARPVFDQKRIRRVKARFAEGFTADRLKRAIDGASLDDWLMGRADGARKGGWRDIETVFRDAAQVERLIALAEANAPTAPARRTATPDLDDDDTRDLTPEELEANARAAAELLACLASGRPVADVAPPAARLQPAPPAQVAPVAPVVFSPEERAELDALAATQARRRAQFEQERAAAAQPISETVFRGAP